MEKIQELLNKSEKVLQLDLHYFFKNSFFLLLRQFFAGLSGFLVSFFLAREFSKYAFGEYQLMLSLLGLLSIFSLPGMMDAVLDAVARGFERSLIKGTRLRFKTSFLAIPVFLFLAGLYYYQEKPTITLLLLLSLPFFPFYYTFKTYEVFLTAKECFFKLFWIASLTSVLSAGVVIINTLIFKKIYITFLSLIISNAILDLYFYLRIKKGIKKTKVDPRMTRFGYFLTFKNLIIIVVNNLDKMILGFFAGLPSIAIFSVAELLPRFVEKTLYALQSVFIPKIIKQGKKGNRETIRQHLFKIIFVSLLIFVAVFLAVPYFIKVFFAPYKESIPLAQALALPLILYLSSGVLNQIITFQKRRKQILFFSLYPALPKMVLYLLLIPRFGVWGLVWSMILSRTLGFIGLLWVTLVND